MDRREFVGWPLAAGFTVALPRVADLSAGRRIGADVAMRLRNRTARLRRLDDMLGGDSLWALWQRVLEVSNKFGCTDTFDFVSRAGALPL